MEETKRLKGRDKPAIVIAAFGSSMAKGQENLEVADIMIRESLKDYQVYWAFTSRFILKKFRDRGIDTVFQGKIPLKDLGEIYTLLEEKGVKEVFVQGLYIINGEEFKIVRDLPTGELDIKYGKPLLYSSKDIENLASALSPEFGESSRTATILCAHGNSKDPCFNDRLVDMDRYLRKNFKNVFLASIEGPPDFDAIVKEISGLGLEKVKFIPLMLTYGDHIANDVMGSSKGSWKSKLGLEASCADGMAANRKVLDIFVERIRSGVSGF